MNLHFLRWWSLKTKVTVFTLVVFVFGIWSLAFHASRMLREEMRQQLGDQQFSIVSVLAAHINEELESRLTALQAAAGTVTPAVLADARALQAHLEERPALLQLFNAGIYVTQRDGTATASSPVSAGRVGVNYMDQDHVAAALEEGKSTISRPRIGKTRHAPVFAITAPIGDAQGRVIGAMVGVVDLSRPNFLDKIAQGTYGRTGGYIVVAPQYRTIVTATDKTYIMQAMPEPGVNPLFDRYVQGFEGSGSTVDSRGLSVFSAAKQIPVAGWLLVGRIPAEEALAPIGAMQQRLLFATIAFTLLAGCLIWWATWRLLRSQLTPMLAAGKALETMTGAAGRLQPLPIGSADEIGELIRAFNRLLETLAQREEALNRSRRLLAETGQLGKVGGWAIDIDTGKQTWTEETHSIHEVEPGYEPTVEKGVSFYTDASRPVIERAVQRAVEQAEPFDLELEIVTAKGNLRNIHVIGKADPAHRRVYGFFQDVTGRKRAEVVLRARLRLSELGHGGSTDDVLRVALDAAEEITASRIGFFHFVDPDQEHLTLQAWSTNTLAQMCTAEGKGRHYPISEAGVWVECFHARAPVIHNDYASVAHKKGMPAGHATVTRELLVPIIRAGKVTEIIGVGNKASDYLQADVEAVQAIAGTVQDLVERIRAEDALRASEERYRRLHESLTDAFVMTDMAGRLVAHNDAYRQMLGYSPEELQSLNYVDLTP